MKTVASLKGKSFIAVKKETVQTEEGGYITIGHSIAYQVEGIYYSTNGNLIDSHLCTATSFKMTEEQIESLCELNPSVLTETDMSHQTLDLE